MVTSQNATLTVLVRPAVIPTSPASHSVDAGGSFCLTVGVDGAPMPAIQWHLNGEPIPGATNLDYCIADANVTHGGFYYVTASNVINSVVSDTATVTVLFRPPDHFCRPI